MLIHFLLFALMVSFTIHILSLIFYFINKSIKFFYIFISTAFLNIICGMALAIYAFQNPNAVQKINYEIILWVLSGLIMFIMVSLKAVIAKRVMTRMKDPASYTLNYFGKKVYSKNIVTYAELGTVFLTIPFFLLVGAYFIAKLYHFLSVN